MKKKILILVFILALALCLAFVSSASNYIDTTNVESSVNGQGTVITYYNDQNGYESTIGERLGVIVYGFGSSSGTETIVCVGFLNIEAWSRCLMFSQVSTADDFLNFIYRGVDSGFWTTSMNMYNILTQKYQEFWLAYQNWYNNDFYYTLVDCQNFHILRKMYYSFDYNGINYKSVIEQFCPKCNYSSYELSSDVLNFLDVFLDTATNEEILNFDFYNTLKLYFFEYENANVTNYYVLEKFVNKLKQIGYTQGETDGYNSGYTQGETNGIIQAHKFTSDWLADNGILYEPWGATGELLPLDGLLQDNVLPAINNAYNNGFGTGKSEGLAEGEATGYTEGVNAALTRMESWLSGENILYHPQDIDGDVSTVSQILDNNVTVALNTEYVRGYNIAYEKGVADGESTSDALREGMLTIFSSPMYILGEVFNFEILGINIYNLITGLLTILIIAFVVTKVCQIFL